ncbi:MAG TPA: glycosyltransferase [Humisphaera sp.]|nr:glycosyltransferase [Humisphaera sp.]
MKRSPTTPVVKVTHLVISLDIGGLERIVVDLAREAHRLAQDVNVLCLERPGKLAHEIEALGIKVSCLSKRPGLSPAVIGKLRKRLLELQPDVLHAHQVGPLFYAGLAAYRAGVRVLLHTEHGKRYANRFRTRLLGRFAGRSAARFICVSDDIAREVRECRIVNPSKIAVVRNGIDTRRFIDSTAGDDVRNTYRIPLDAPVIGTVGRLAEVKRQDVLIRGFARIRRSEPRAHLLLVGDGPLRGELETLARSLGLADCVHFAGYQPDPARFLHAMNAFALTSRSEGMPLCVLEAWAAGVPVVASRVGGVPELIRHGSTGLMFESGNEQELAATVLHLLRDTDLRSKIRDAARMQVQSEFDVSIMADQYDRHYRQLLGLAGSNAPSGDVLCNPFRSGETGDASVAN